MSFTTKEPVQWVPKKKEKGWYRYHIGQYFLLVRDHGNYCYWDVCKTFPPDEEHLGMEYSIALEKGGAKSVKDAMERCEKAFNFWRQYEHD